jgi:hypothetical protein
VQVFHGGLRERLCPVLSSFTCLGDFFLLGLGLVWLSSWLGVLNDLGVDQNVLWDVLDVRSVN